MQPIFKTVRCQIVFAFLFTLLISSELSALGFAYTAESLVQQSELIVVGRVLSVESKRVGENGTSIRTYFQFEVERYLNGSTQDNPIEFVSSGGRANGMVEEVSYSAAIYLLPGDHLLVFLGEHENQWFPIGGTRGVYRVISNNGGPELLEPVTSVEVVVRQTDQFTKRTGPLLNATTVEDIELIIEGQKE